MKCVIAILASALVISLTGWKLCFPDRGEFTAVPAIECQWNEQVYGLDQDEVLRLVYRPFPAQHDSIFTSRDTSMPAPDSGQLTYFLSNNECSLANMTRVRGTLRSAIEQCARSGTFRPADYEIEHEIKSIPVDGDWIVNFEASVERQMQALESILTQATGQSLIIERRSAGRPVIAIRGRCKFQPDAAGARHHILYLYESPDDLGPQRAGPLVASAGIQSLLPRLESYTEKHLIDETANGISHDLVWIDAVRRRFCGNEPPQDGGLILKNISRQTSLQFVETQRPIPVWFIRLKKG